MRPRIIVEPPGPRAKKILGRDGKIISQSLPRTVPLVVERAYGSNIEDPDGNVFLDFASGIAVANVGHSNPEVTAAIKAQLEKVAHAAFMDFYAEVPVQLAELIHSALSFKHRYLNNVFFSNSGTEAIEAAMKLARWNTRRKYFLAFHNCFHGRTYGSLSLTTAKIIHRAGFGPFLDSVHAPYPNTYRCPFEHARHGDACGDACIDYIEREIFRKVGAENIAACFVEPVQGEGGYIVPPRHFLRDLQRLCKSHGILFVADEVQSGCYRTGRFLASEHFGIKPDIVTLSKAIGGGLPLGVTMASKKLMGWPKGAHASTFGGNLASCAAGIAALNIMRRRGFGRSVEKKGKYIMDWLRDLQQESKLIGDVRGLGLMIGLELSRHGEARIPAERERDAVLKEAFKRGLIVIEAGESVIRFAPPLIIEWEDIEAGMQIFGEALMAVERKSAT